MFTPLPDQIQSQPIDPIHASLRHMMTAVISALPTDPRGAAEDHAMHRHAAVAILGALHPEDPIQHMLAAQAAAAHFAALEFFRRAADPDRTDEASSRLARTADAMVRLMTCALDRLKRCQSGQTEHRRAATPGLAAATANSGGKDSMAGEKPMPGLEPAPRAEAATATPEPRQAPPANRKPPATAATLPRQRENNRQDPMPGEPCLREPNLPFDRQGWIAAVRSMSPQDQHALANRIQALRNEPRLPAAAAG